MPPYVAKLVITFQKNIIVYLLHRGESRKEIYSPSQGFSQPKVLLEKKKRTKVMLQGYMHTWQCVLDMCPSLILN